MRLIATLGLLPIALLTAVPANAQMATLSPEAIGQMFCFARQGDDMDAVSGLLSAELAAAISYAEARNAVAARAAPDDKPPLGDGVPWQSYPDVADSCTVGAVMTSATATGVEIHYSFTDAPDAAFTDTLVLVPEPRGDGMPPVLRIDDLTYGVGGSLVDTLAAVFAASSD